MRILALETTGVAGSVAAWANEGLLAEHALEPQQRSGQSLAPAMHGLLADVGWKPTDVQLIAVPIGPGSFTGLRVGVTTAKAFAYAVGAEVLGLNTLEVIAWQAPREASAISVVMDAQRQQLFVGDFRREGDLITAVDAPCITDAAQWLAQSPADVWITGPGLKSLRGRIAASRIIAPVDAWQPRASTVARLAAMAFAAGQRDSLWDLEPRYYRESAAEEKWRERHP